MGLRRGPYPFDLAQDRFDDRGYSSPLDKLRAQNDTSPVIARLAKPAKAILEIATLRSR